MMLTIPKHGTCARYTIGALLEPVMKPPGLWATVLNPGCIVVTSEAQRSHQHLGFSPDQQHLICEGQAQHGWSLLLFLICVQVSVHICAFLCTFTSGALICA